MIHVYICSPYRGHIDANKQVARTICAELSRRGCANFAPHLYYPQFLDDNDPDQRTLGISLALADIDRHDAIWVFKGNGITDGMLSEISKAQDLGKPIIRQMDLSDFETPFKNLVSILEGFKNPPCSYPVRS